MNWKNFFPFNIFKLIIALIILLICFWLIQPLFLVYKPGANPPIPYSAYIFAAIFILDVFYIFLMVLSKLTSFIKNKMEVKSETEITINPELRKSADVKPLLGNRPYWLKGVIIALSIYFISVLSIIISEILGRFFVLAFLSIFSALPTLIIQGIIVSTFKLSSSICGPVAFTYSCPFYIDVIAFIFTGILYLVAGVLLGWIIGKIKSRTVSR